ncbi:hypothetical protein K402DRAFT_402086 [Aulographum hederae CBS 113979]|uniref:Uncharacterized protein n=1 Tax=Aulographum hederae CBS 113979 TaxID=1176131 RepID=A0A6G1H8A0_9PEZI|nr:hypothetical protein K402DRAFT_402086 [Aulographum hederae CBS 113979]
MKTVPTLCASATIVGVSSLGYALGRPEQTDLPLDKQTPTRSPSEMILNPFHPSEPSPNLTSSYTSNSPLSSTSATSQFPARYIDEQNSSVKQARRLTAGDALFQQHTANFGRNSLPEIQPVQPDTRIPLRSQSSWRKRISQISSSRESSPHPLSPRPQTPSVLTSNDSTIFSYTGSTAPIIGSRPTTAPRPNKLVKRSSSLRLSDGPPNSNLRWRRPATSHQRSATLKERRKSAIGPHDGRESVGDDDQPSIEGPWKQYFRARVIRDDTEPRRFGSSGALTVKRISPDERYLPTLLMTKSVMASSVEIDDWSDDGDSFFFSSRPMTPAGLPLPEPRGHSGEAALTDKPSEDSTDKPSRRSFSIGDLLSTGPSSKKLRPGSAIGRKLLRKASLRVSSAPTAIPSDASDGRLQSDRPTKRRDITDPTIFKRQVYSSSSNESPTTSAVRTVRGHSPETSHVELTPPISRFNVDAARSRSDPSPTLLSYQATAAPPIRSSQAVAQPSHSQATVRPSQHSASASEQASTLVGSDSDTRGLGSGEEDELELGNETQTKKVAGKADPLNTKVKRSISGARRGPRIETIFDESPPKLLPPRNTSNTPETPTKVQKAMSDMGMSHVELKSTKTSTPIRGPPHGDKAAWKQNEAADSDTSFDAVPSSPPVERASASIDDESDWDRESEDKDEAHWSFGEEDTDQEELEAHIGTIRMATPLSMKRNSAILLDATKSSPLPTAQQLAPFRADKDKDKDTKSSIFDWSEQPHSDRSPGNHTPPRPKTVHGKKDSDIRGSRSTGRRAPSALHARSHSVPVVPEVTGKHDTVAMNKFGTWGQGSKIVTEDWDEDFEFQEPLADQAVSDERRVDSGLAMKIPQNIQEQQNNVVANIGLLREWGLLIEELKVLRIRAVALGMLEGPHARTWEEVDAMIELADQEAETPVVPPGLSPPSSPGFDMDAFEEELAPNPTVRHKRKSLRSVSANNAETAATILHHAPRSRRKSVLPSDGDIFAAGEDWDLPADITLPLSPSKQVIITRPRKDSEAVARSVIEAIQKRNSFPDAVVDFQSTPTATKKVPFDTATLRHIVPHVKGLMRKVQDAMRETEGLYSSPDPSPKPSEPHFSKMFRDPPENRVEPPDGSPSSRKARRSRPNNASRRSEDSSYKEKENELSKQMKLMTVM